MASYDLASTFHQFLPGERVVAHRDAAPRSRSAVGARGDGEQAASLAVAAQVEIASIV